MLPVSEVEEPGNGGAQRFGMLLHHRPGDFDDSNRAELPLLDSHHVDGRDFTAGRLQRRIICACEARMTRADIEALITRRSEGWTRHDAALLAADFAEDAVAESPMQGRLVGRRRIQEVYEAGCRRSRTSNSSRTTSWSTATGWSQFFTMAGTQTAPFGGVPATGRRFQITGALIATVADDGRVTHERRIYDVTNMLVQLGALRTKPVTL